MCSAHGPSNAALPLRPDRGVCVARVRAAPNTAAPNEKRPQHGERAWLLPCRVRRHGGVGASGACGGRRGARARGRTRAAASGGGRPRGMRRGCGRGAARRQGGRCRIHETRVHRRVRRHGGLGGGGARGGGDERAGGAGHCKRPPVASASTSTATVVVDGAGTGASTGECSDTPFDSAATRHVCARGGAPRMPARLVPPPPPALTRPWALQLANRHDLVPQRSGSGAIHNGSDG